jgi:hypothetical protein
MEGGIRKKGRKKIHNKVGRVNSEKSVEDDSENVMESGIRKTSMEGDSEKGVERDSQRGEDGKIQKKGRRVNLQKDVERDSQKGMEGGIRKTGMEGDSDKGAERHSEKGVEGDSEKGTEGGDSEKGLEGDSEKGAKPGNQDDVDRLSHSAMLSFSERQPLCAMQKRSSPIESGGFSQIITGHLANMRDDIHSEPTVSLNS